MSKRSQRPDAAHNSSALRASSRSEERRFIEIINNAETIKRYEVLLRQIRDGKLDVPGFIKRVSLDAALHLADIMNSGENDKVRLEAAKDILDRAGYGKTHKVAIAGSINVDHDTSKMELVNLILSSARRAGIKVKDDAPVYEGLPAAKPAEVIDVTPVAPAEIVGEPDDEGD